MNKELNQKSDLQKIKETIKKYIEREIPYIPLADISSFSKKIKRHETNTEYKNMLIHHSGYPTHEILEKFFEQKWVKAQPHDKAIKDKSKKFFIKGYVDSKSIQTQSYINTDEGIESFLNFVINNQNGLIHIKGKRGSGKTFTMNYILNLYTEELQKNNLFWVRATLFKVYEKNKDELKCNIKDYLSEKLLRICLKYSEYEDNICKELREFIENYINKNSEREKARYLYEFITKFKETERKFNEKFGEGSLDEFLLKVVEIFRNFMKKEFNSTGENVIWGKLKDDYDSVDNLRNFEFEIKTDFGSYHFLGLLIFFITQIKGRKLLIILDSMDNIDYLMKENSFNELMKQLEDFINFCRGQNNVLVVVSGRPETLEYLKPNGLRGNNSAPDKIFETAKINVEEFLKKRLDYIAETTGKRVSDFEKFIENYVCLFHSCIKQKIDSYIKRKIDIGDINPNNFIQEFYEYSYRDIYDDLIHNFAFIKDYIRKKSKSDINENTDILKEGVINTNSIIVGGKNKTYILNQGGYTSGCVYRNKSSCNGKLQSIDFRSGHEFFNFFEPFYNEKENTYIPFLYLNTINFIVEEYLPGDSFSLNDIYRGFLSSSTKPAKCLVKKEYLEKVLRKFVEYSILDTDSPGIYKTTNRAEYLLGLVKSDPYLIHTLILDTKLPKYIRDRINLHKNDYSDIGQAIFRNVILAVQTINSVSKYLYKQNIFFKDKDKDIDEIDKLAEILSKSTLSNEKKEEILKELSAFERDIEYDVYIIFTGDNGREITRRIAKNLLIRNPYMRIFFDEFRYNDKLQKTKSIIIIHNRDLEEEMYDMKIFKFLEQNNSVYLSDEISYALNRHKGFVFIFKGEKFRAKYDFKHINEENRFTTADEENLINTILERLNSQR